MSLDVDVVISKTDDGYWDLSINNDGDFTKTDSFDTAILLSLFGSDRRASPDEQIDPALRRGWIGDQYSAVELGSKLWLLSQARLFRETENRARDYVSQCLQWLVDFKYAERVVVSTRRNLTKGQMIADVVIGVVNGVTNQRSYVLWENTGK